MYYMLGSPRSATTYLTHILGRYLLYIGEIDSVLGEYFHFHRQQHEKYHLIDDRISFLGIAPGELTPVEWQAELLRRFDLLRQNPRVLFKVFVRDLGVVIDGTPLSERLSELEFNPVLIDRRDRGKQFLSYAVMRLTGNSYHWDNVVKHKDLVCPRRIYEAFVHNCALLDEYKKLYRDSPLVYVEDLTGNPIEDLKLIGIDFPTGVDFNPLPKRPVYESNDPYSHFSNRDEIMALEGSVLSLFPVSPGPLIPDG